VTDSSMGAKGDSFDEDRLLFSVGRIGVRY